MKTSSIITWITVYSNSRSVPVYKWPVSHKYVFFFFLQRHFVFVCVVLHGRCSVWLSLSWAVSGLQIHTYTHQWKGLLCFNSTFHTKNSIKHCLSSCCQTPLSLADFSLLLVCFLSLQWKNYVEIIIWSWFKVVYMMLLFSYWMLVNPLILTNVCNIPF